jgi:hypothetical protein
MDGYGLNSHTMTHAMKSPPLPSSNMSTLPLDPENSTAPHAPFKKTRRIRLPVWNLTPRKKVYAMKSSALHVQGLHTGAQLYPSSGESSISRYHSILYIGHTPLYLFCRRPRIQTSARWYHQAALWRYEVCDRVRSQGSCRWPLK